ncbi:NYN domain-containing protein [Planctomicrobium piriforme]|uniref:YacP-like NYN domain-containing protein n=1 Tax=Planctomicrobium piriforme TaxID=1576369 RepID=A0A1I3F1L5_9PLAN|nr:NYN domain-containing protein [Planctomicrobium piriforme]SFI05129.1 hypothetical protein SAMN05421753_10541 [Planctomicrobium piriforme]
MAVELIIDGYNLLHLAGLARAKYRPGQFEQARDRLLKRLLLSMTEAERAHTTIVFDAQYAEQADRRTTVIHGMQVVFSPRGRQADDLIEDMLCSIPNTRQVRVVSSDRRLRRAARAVKAGYIDSDSFLVELDARREKSERSVNSPATAPPPPVNRPAVKPLSKPAEPWPSEFADLDLAEIERSVQAELDAARPTPTVAPTPVITPSKPVAKPQPQTTSLESELLSAAQLLNDPNHKPQRVVPGPPDAKPKVATAPPAVPPAELSFWEQRIAELGQEDDGRPRRR